MDIVLYDSGVNVGWYDNIDEWVDACDTGSLEIPLVNLYPRYYISNNDRTKLIHSGSLCLKDEKEICEEVLPYDGKFVYRVAGYELDAGTTSWDFCGTSGTIHQELQFEMRKGKCFPVQKLTADQYCSGIVSLGIFSGAFLLSNVHSGAVTAYDTSVLEHIIQSSIGMSSAKVFITTTSYSNDELTVQFRLSAVMEELHMDGVFGDMVEAFSDNVISQAQNAALQGFYMNMLTEDLRLNILSSDDVLSTTTSFSFLYLELTAVEYMDAVTQKVIPSAEVFVATESNSNEFGSLLQYGVSGIMVLFGGVLAVVLLTVSRRRRTLTDSGVVNSQEKDVMMDSSRAGILFDVSDHTEEDDMDIIDSSQRLMIRRT